MMCTLRESSESKCDTHLASEINLCGNGFKQTLNRSVCSMHWACSVNVARSVTGFRTAFLLSQCTERYDKSTERVARKTHLYKCSSTFQHYDVIFPKKREA